MNPQIFGWQHLTFLAIFIVISAVTLVLVKKYAKSTKSQEIIVRCVGGVLLAFILANRIIIAINDGQAIKFIPNTFCGMSSLVLALAVLFGRRNNNVLHFVVHVALVGDILTLCYPEFISNSVSLFYAETFTGLMHHAVGLYLCLLLYLVRWFVPTYKKWINLAVGFMAYITFGCFSIHALNFTHAFFIDHAILSGTPLTIWIIAPIFAVGYAIFMVIVEWIRRKKKKETKPISFNKIIKIIKSNP